MRSQRLLIPVVLILLSPFIFATSPTLPPYHQFYVSGRIERPSGGTKKNFSVALFAKPAFQQPTSDFGILNQARQNDSPIAITDSTGSFYLVASSDIKPDSVVVGLVVPDRSVLFGQKISVIQLQAIPNTITRDYYDDDPTGCNGCQSSPRKQTVTTHYSYSLYDQIVVIPY